MSEPLLEVIDPGFGAGIQDMGRAGWKRFGVPPGGAMDMDSAGWANALLGNDASAPVIEMLFSGARFRVLRRVEFALTGADAECNRPYWRSMTLEAGEEIHFRRVSHGVWSYLAVRGGLTAPRWFGSASVNPRAGMGSGLKKGDLLSGHADVTGLGGAIAGRFLMESARPLFDACPMLPVWPGPEWDWFSEECRSLLFDGEWKISPQSDRTGYRLDGPGLQAPQRQMLSGPVLTGSIQVPSGGHPIVILRDGPTVGGYPRLAILDSAAVSRFTQCAPGSVVRFTMIDDGH